MLAKIKKNIANLKYQLKTLDSLIKRKDTNVLDNLSENNEFYLEMDEKLRIIGDIKKIES